MPETGIRFYREADGTVPVLDWLADLHKRERRAYVKCREVIGRLATFGHELRRPTSDFLEDGVYELRARIGRVNYRVLYFFHGRHVALLTHGLTKERDVPRAALGLALQRKRRFEANPARHTYEE